MKTSNVEGTLSDEPAPTPELLGAVRDAVFNYFAKLQVGKCVEINRKVRVTRNYVYRFRKTYGMEMRFIIRPSKKFGWTKVWRVE